MIARRQIKQAMVPGLQQVINLVGIPAARSSYSPLRNYYEAMARQGVQQGFNHETVPTIAPQWGMASAGHIPFVGMAGSGAVDYATGRAVGGELRHAWDNAASKHPALQQLAGGQVPDLDRLIKTIRENRAPALDAARQAAASGSIPSTEQALQALPISRRNRRRLRRALPAHLQTILSTANDLGEGKPLSDQLKSPVLRHVVGGLERDTTHPVVQHLQKNYSSMEAPKAQAARSLGTAAATGLIGSVPHAALHALHDPIGAAAEVVGHTATHAAKAAPEAALLHAAEKGKYNTLAAVKLRMMSSGARAAEAPWWHPGRWGRKLVHTALGAVDPSIKEFTLAGEDLVHIKRRAAELARTKAQASGDRRAVKQVNKLERTAQTGMQNLHGAGSAGSILSGLGKDFLASAAPAHGAVAGVAPQPVKQPPAIKKILTKLGGHRV